MFYQLGRFPWKGNSLFYFSVGLRRLSILSLLMRGSESYPLNSLLKGIKRHLSRVEIALNWVRRPDHPGDGGSLIVYKLAIASASHASSIKGETPAGEFHRFLPDLDSVRFAINIYWKFGSCYIHRIQMASILRSNNCHLRDDCYGSFSPILFS